MTFQLQHATPFYIYGKGNFTAPAIHTSDIGTGNAHHEALIQAALWYGTWYYSGTITDSEGVRNCIIQIAPSTMLMI